jgi:hypothetical protein
MSSDRSRITYYDEHVPGSSVAVLGHSVGEIWFDKTS